ncbi:MAG: hypothetical protein GJ676_04655 [Rhodobacteraceae bacterium]|nr:hypothetical protein [Paracoccaceae bacterium]
MLNPGDLIFVGWDADNNDVAFVTTADIAAGEVIYFTDSEWNGSSFNAGEQLIEWTVPAGGISAGSILTLDMFRAPAGAVVTDTAALDGAEVGTIDYISGGGNLRFGNEMLWAFQGDRVGDDVTPENFVSVIGNEADGNSNQTPNLTNTGLTQDNGAIIIDGDHDYMIFDGFDALPDPYTAQGVIDAISDTSNWTVDGAGLNFVNNNPLPDNGFATIDPVRLYDPEDVTTLFFSGDQVAFFDDVSSDDGDVSTNISVSNQPFLPTDIVEIDILNESIRPDGEFDYDEVIFTRVAVTRDGVTYEFEINDGAKIKESGATNSSSGQAIEQGDSFFTTNDELNSLVRAPVSGPFASVPEGKLVFANNATFVEGEVTNIVREQQVTDDQGNPVGDVNANFFYGLFLEPIPCFVAGTHLMTARGALTVEHLRVGDRVLTRDNGYQPIRWIASRTCPAIGALTPIRIKADTLGNTNDLLVSPQHRLLVCGWRAELLFGETEVLVPAKYLCNDDTIRPAHDTEQVTYFHILFDRHEIIYAEGAPAESLDFAFLKSLSEDHEYRREIDTLFPELVSDHTDWPQTARYSVRAFEGHLIAKMGV